MYRGVSAPTLTAVYMVPKHVSPTPREQSVFVDQIVVSIGPAVVSPTPAPTPVPVQVDMVPCILATETIVSAPEDRVGDCVTSTLSTRSVRIHVVFSKLLR